MIALLRGIVAQKEVEHIVLDVGGVGYAVHTTPQVMHGLAEGQEATLLIAENIKEDSYTLYGFLDSEQKNLYLRLLSVNGVGSKVAMAILASNEAGTLVEAVRAGNVVVFSSVSGVGAKTAQRIVLELKGKIDLSGPSAQEGGDPAHQALVSLGYSSQQANDALRGIDPKLDTGSKVKAALKGLKR
jgi:Holliday junction DNA helicase RuvA